MKCQILVATALLGFAAAASAQTYAVASVGSATLNVDCTGAATCDKSDTAVKLIFGYKFNPNLAVELGYFDFGKARASGSGVSAEIGNTAVGLGLAYHQEMAPNWNFVARLGAAQMKTKITGAIVGLGSGSDSDNNMTAYGGLGIGYMFSKSVSLGAAWDFSKSKYNKNGVDESGNINAYGLNLMFEF